MSDARVDIRDGVCGYVAGGLGNQLFILGAALRQATRLGAPLYLDTSFETRTGTRASELDTFPHPGRMLGDDSPWRSVRLSPNRVVPFPRLRAPLRRRVYLERDGVWWDGAIDRIERGTTLFGYFQSAKYFAGVEDVMQRAIEDAPADEAARAVLDRIAADPRITVHLRRGDYLDDTHARRVIASADYVRRGTGVLRDLGLEAPLRVFSDSPDMVREELGDRSDVEVFDDAGALNSILTIRAMATAPAIIMSNSTFSWWAAWLLRRRRPDAPVIAPRPWDASGSAKADLIGEDWIGVDAR